MMLQQFCMSVRLSHSGIVSKRLNIIVEILPRPGLVHGTRVLRIKRRSKVRLVRTPSSSMGWL